MFRVNNPKNSLGVNLKNLQNLYVTNWNSFLTLKYYIDIAIDA